MREPPEGIEISDEFSQEEIESVFNTGFGYQISGINPRRDERLSEEEAVKPHPMFLAEHREFNGFNDD